LNSVEGTLDTKGRAGGCRIHTVFPAGDIKTPMFVSILSKVSSSIDFPLEICNNKLLIDVDIIYFFLLSKWEGS